MNMHKIVAVFLMVVVCGFGKGGSYDCSGSSAISIDAQNNKWFSGVTKYDGEIYTHYGSNEGGIGLNYVEGIAIDKLGNIWFATNGYGVIKFDGTNWTTYRTTNGLVDNHVVSITTDAQNNVWCGTFSGVSKYDGTSWSTMSNVSYVYAIDCDSQGNIWCGGSDVLMKYDGTNWISYSSGAGQVWDIAIDRKGNVWCGGSSGASKFDGTVLSIYTSANGLPYNSSNPAVPALAVDRFNNVWFGTYSGVAKFDGVKWAYYDTSNGLTGSEVQAIAVDSIGVILFGINGGAYCWTDEKIEMVFKPAIFSIHQDSPINTACGKLETSIFINPETGVTYTFLSGSETFQIVNDTLKTTRLLTTADDTLRASIESSKNGQKDTLDVRIPVNHWQITGVNPTISIEMKREQKNFDLPLNKDVTIDLRITPKAGFGATTDLNTTNGTLSKTSWTVPANGELVTLKLKPEDLKLGQNIITVTGKNDVTILGTAICTVMVKDGFAVTPSRVIDKDTTGQVGEFTVGLSDFGKAYFAGEDVEVKASLLPALTLSISEFHQGGDAKNTNLAILDLSRTQQYYEVGWPKSQRLNLLEGKYTLLLYGNSMSSIGNLSVILQDMQQNVVVYKNNKMNPLDSYTHLDGTYWGSYWLSQFSVEGTSTDLGTLSSPTTTLPMSITATGDTTSQVVTFTGKTSGKTLVSDPYSVTLPYQFVTVSDTAAYSVISSGVADSVTGDVWIYSVQSDYPYTAFGLSVLKNNVWTKFPKASTSNLLSDTVNVIRIAPNGKVWVGSDKGISIYNGTTWETPITTAISGLNVTDIRFSGTDIYVYNGVWDKFSGGFWSKNVDATTVPKTSGARSTDLISGFTKSSGRYSYEGQVIKKYTLVVPQAPTNLTLSDSIFIDSLSVNQTVGTVACSDINDGETHTYSLPVGSDSFLFVKDTLKAKVKIETDSSFITVRATDSRGLFTEKQFVILRKSAPTDIVFKDLSKIDTVESMNIFGVFSSVDFNTEETHTYSTPDQSVGKFIIAGDTLKSTYAFTEAQTVAITSTDSYGLTCVKNFVVVNKFTPSAISLSTVIIPDSAMVGSVIARASTTDENTDETYAYSVISGPVVFKGDTLKATAKITVQTPITIRSTDSRGLFVDKVFSLIVKKMNGINFYDTVTTTVSKDTVITKSVFGVAPKKDTVVQTTIRSVTIDTTWLVSDSIRNGLSVSHTKTFKSKVVAYDTLNILLDTLIYQSGIKGDYTGDGILDVSDFGYAAQLWKKSKTTATIDPACELAPFDGLFPMITVKPDGKYDYKDLRVYLDFCWYNSQNAKSLAPLPQSRASRDLVAETELFGDSVKITLRGDLAGVSAASCELSSENGVTWNRGRSVQTGGTVFPMTEQVGGVSRFSLACTDPISENGDLVSVMVARSSFDSGAVTIRYALLDEHQNVIGSGSVDATIAKAVEETIAKGLTFNAYPNPSAQMSRGGEGFVFVANNGDVAIADLSVKVFSAVGTLMFSADMNQFVKSEEGVFTVRWDANNAGSGSYLAVLEIVGVDGKSTRQKLMIGVVK